MTSCSGRFEIRFGRPPAVRRSHSVARGSFILILLLAACCTSCQRRNGRIINVKAGEKISAPGHYWIDGSETFESIEAVVAGDKAQVHIEEKLFGNIIHFNDFPIEGPWTIEIDEDKRLVIYRSGTYEGFIDKSNPDETVVRSNRGDADRVDVPSP